MMIPHKPSRQALILTIGGIVTSFIIFCSFICSWDDLLSLIRESTDQSTLHHVINNEGDLKVLWSRSNIITRGSEFCMVAANGLVFLIEAAPPLQIGTIIALQADGMAADAASEEVTVLWKDIGPTLRGQRILYATSTVLYAGSGATTYVTSYDLGTGAILWQQRLKSSERGVSSIQVDDGKVYVRASNYEFVVDADTGELLEEGYFLAAIDQSYFRKGVLVDEILLIRGAMMISAIDRETDKDLWDIENVVSNPVVADETVYVLTGDAQLLSLNLLNGKVVDSVQFDKFSAGYLAVDQEQQLLYVYLYDSEQLFAFKIQSSS